MTTGSPLSRETVFVRRNNLTVQLDSCGSVLITCDGADVEAGPHALAVLDAFGTPRTIAEVVAELSVEGAQDFAALTRTILQLRSANVLTTPGATLSEGVGWDQSSVHARMLSDTTRTTAFIRAIRETVRPDDVVVDIGTGTGVLAIAAAQAGARMVYAIEATAIGEVASEMFARNGLSGRIELVRGWSTRVTLPERATVMVSETIGNDALGEGIVETVLDARKRLLTPDARLIPDRIKVWGIPCSLPDAIRERHLFTEENTTRWSRELGMAFEPLARVERKPFALVLPPAEVRGWRALAAPVLLADEPTAALEGTYDREATFRAEVAGQFDAAILYFDLGLSPSETFMTHPERVNDHHSWKYMVWVNDQPRGLEPGDEAMLRYSYRFGAGKVRFG